MVSLDSDLRGGLARGDAKALASWKAIAAAVEFFEQRRAWSALEPLGVVGVVSDFKGPNEATSGEILNLLGRRNLAYRILEASAAATAALAGFRALIYVDQGAPAPQLRSKLLAFAEQGGLLMAGAEWDRAVGKPTGMDHPRVDVRQLGKGRLAVSKASEPDPFMIARDVHMLLGRTYDVARFFNLSAFLSYCAASPDRTRGSGADSQFRHPLRRRRGHRVGSREIRFGAPVESGRRGPLAHRNGCRKRRHKSSAAARAGVRRRGVSRKAG